MILFFLMLGSLIRVWLSMPPLHSRRMPRPFPVFGGLFLVAEKIRFPWVAALRLEKLCLGGLQVQSFNHGPVHLIWLTAIS